MKRKISEMKRRTACDPDTREFVAPEVFHVASGLRTRYDECVNGWSLGAVNLELLGDLPQWEGNQEQYFRRIQDKLSSQTQPFYTFLRHMLVKDPTERASASECLTTLWPTDLQGRIDDSGVRKRHKPSMTAKEQRITRSSKPMPDWLESIGLCAVFSRTAKTLSRQDCCGTSPKKRRLNQQHCSKKLHKALEQSRIRI